MYYYITMCLLYLLLLNIHISHGILLGGDFVNIPSYVNVHSPVGDIIGKVVDTQFDGKRYQVKEFLGIPYAEPPVGDNRFRKPVPKSPFTSPYRAIDFGSPCWQVRDDGNLMSEDCLYLNIHVPYLLNASLSRLPVMVWIHGGGFQHGTGNYYIGDTLSAFGEVIVVSFNYRISYLGFLPVLDGTGNFGLWDQHLAIKWVHENIEAFGGDVSRITVFGESAGSSSVVYQSFFPGNKGLFQRVIAESGGINSPWAFDRNATANNLFQTFASAAGCKGSRDQILWCLRNKTTDEIAHVMKQSDIDLPAVHPSADNDFVPKSPPEMLIPSPDQNASMEFFYGLDFMMGSNSADGALFLYGYAAELNITDINQLKIPRDLYEMTLIPREVMSVFPDVRSIPEQVVDAVVYEYTDWAEPDDFISRNKILSKLMTDIGMIVPMVVTGQLHSKSHRGRTYLFELSVRPGTHMLELPSWLDGPTQASHGDDILYVFGYSDRMVKSAFRFKSNYSISDEDIRTSKLIMTMWTNFAKSG